MSKPTDRIVVNGLVVQSYVGVLERERGQRQALRFDVEMHVVPNYASLVRETGRYVSYADVVDYIVARAATDEHVELVETWAEDVATFALRNDLVATVTVSVGKPDIFAEAESVGIVITRQA
ncbi:MAG: dihydroneopterin aldolase [Pseudomonadota bacterium]